MLPVYLEGFDVTITVPLIDMDGNAVSATAVKYRVHDQAENEIVPQTDLATFTSGDADAVVTVPAISNMVSATLTGPAGLQIPNTRDLRVIELIITTDTGTFRLENEYVIEKTEILLEGINSFQTYSNALFLSTTINDLPSWNSASKRDRSYALIRARDNIGHLRFRYVFDAYQNIVENTLGVADLTLSTKAQFDAFPQQFKDALRRAQIIEADYVLGGDDLGDLRREGVLSLTVGESKQFLRPVKPLSGPVSKRTYGELAKWVLSRHRTVRT